MKAALSCLVLVGLALAAPAPGQLDDSLVAPIVQEEVGADQLVLLDPEIPTTRATLQDAAGAADFDQDRIAVAVSAEESAEDDFDAFLQSLVAEPDEEGSISSERAGAAGKPERALEGPQPPRGKKPFPPPPRRRRPGPVPGRRPPFPPPPSGNERPRPPPPPPGHERGFPRPLPPDSPERFPPPPGPPRHDAPPPAPPSSDRRPPPPSDRCPPFPPSPDRRRPFPPLRERDEHRHSGPWRLRHAEDDEHSIARQDRQSRHAASENLGEFGFSRFAQVQEDRDVPFHGQHGHHGPHHHRLHKSGRMDGKHSLSHAFRHFFLAASMLGSALVHDPVFFAVWTAVKLVVTGAVLIKGIALVRARRQGQLRLEDGEEEEQVEVGEKA